MALLGRDTWVKGPFPGGVEVLLETFRGEEQLGRPYHYTIGLISHDPRLDANDVLGKPLSVGIKLETGGQRFFHGMVSSFEKIGATKRYTHYQATLRPLLGVLENTLECRIFNTPSQTALSIVTSVLDGCHITDLDATALGEHTYLAREYCLQYRESSFNFVQRLLEEEGIYYFFTHSENKHMLVLADAASAHKTAPGYESVMYAAKEEKLAEEHFWDLRVRRHVHPGRHTVLAGYQPTELRSKQLQFGRATSEDLVVGYEFEHYDYPGGLFVPDEVEREAKLRAEQRAADNTVVEVEGNTMGLGVGDLLSLRPGFSGAVAGVPFWTPDDFAKQYLVVRASYSISIDQYETGQAAQADQPFRARYGLTDTKKPYRAPRLARKPVMRGPQTAVVVGPDHEEIWTDPYGRVCVQFDWDRQGKHDERSSCWMRVSSGFAGGMWGEVHIPRIGHEVLVRFLDGDPDRPIIAGELYNADNLPPYQLPANKTQSGTKSRSSKKGTPSNFNEIRFEDLKGEEELHTQAEKDMSTLVKDSQILEVGHDRKIAVGHDEKNHVTEERALTVGGDDEVTVLGNHHKTVVGSVSQRYHGDHTRTVHGDQSLVAMKNKDERVGLVHKLTADQKFQLNQSTTTMTFESTNATVDSAQGELVAFAGGATFSIDEAGLIELDSPVGVKLTCGASSLAVTAGGVALAAPSITASAGGGATMGLGDAGASMNGKKVTIEADGVCKIDGKKKIKLQEAEGRKGKQTQKASTNGSGSAASADTSEGPSSIRQDAVYDEQLRLVDQTTGKPLADCPYVILRNNRVVTRGRTDSDGLTVRVSSGSSEAEMKILWGEDAEAWGSPPAPASQPSASADSKTYGFVWDEPFAQRQWVNLPQAWGIVGFGTEATLSGHVEPKAAGQTVAFALVSDPSNPTESTGAALGATTATSDADGKVQAKLKFPIYPGARFRVSGKTSTMRSAVESQPITVWRRLFYQVTEMAPSPDGKANFQAPPGMIAALGQALDPVWIELAPGTKQTATTPHRPHLTAAERNALENSLRATARDDKSPFKMNIVLIDSADIVEEQEWSSPSSGPNVVTPPFLKWPHEATVIRAEYQLGANPWASLSNVQVVDLTDGQAKITATIPGHPVGAVQCRIKYRFQRGTAAGWGGTTGTVFLCIGRQRRANPASPTGADLQQALTHEIGHALGLVPVAAGWRDTDPRDSGYSLRHCGNRNASKEPRCIMWFMLGGAGPRLQFCSSNPPDDCAHFLMRADLSTIRWI